MHQSPVAGDGKKFRPKSDRKPLQPKNSPAIPNPLTQIQVLKPNPAANDSNKENHHHQPVFVTPKKFAIAPLDASLAEELSAIRKKVERLRVEKERTEKMLNEREMLLDLKMEEMLERCEAQKKLEIEVDRLFRLKEIQSSSLKISPMRSLREKEHEKKNSQVIWQGMRDDEDMEASVSSSGLQSPCLSVSSSCGSNSTSSQLVAVK